MEFYEIKTLLKGEFSTEKEDIMIVTNDVYIDFISNAINTFAKKEGMKVENVTINQLTPEDVIDYYTSRIINEIIPSIHREKITQSNEITVREYAKICKSPEHHALALKEFDEKYSIYKILVKRLDLTKISASDLFERIDKLYAARLTDEYIDVFKEVTKIK